MPNLWLCGSQQTVENSSRDGNDQTTLLAYWETCTQVKKQQLELDMEQQQPGSKLGKEYIKAVYCHSAYLTYMQSTSCKILGGMKNKLESWLPGEISITPHDTTLMAESEELKNHLMKVEEENVKFGL